MIDKNITTDNSFQIKYLDIKEIENVEDICIHIVDSESRTICYSKGCEKIEGQDRENVLGKTIDDLYTFSESTYNIHGSIQKKVLETGQVMKNIRVKYNSGNKKEIEVISSTYPVFSDDKSKVIAAICVFRDLSDYVQMANTIQKLEQDLASQRAQQRLNGTIFCFNDILGRSEATKETNRLARKAASSKASVLITGSTGTGKEVYAQSIHNESQYSNGPFVAINCSAIPDNLLESTLFGTCKGAYTGATESKGLFETAENGTLFLDEINSMNIGLQAKLLRVLETKMIRKVGGNNMIPVNVRIISATNQDPLQAIKEKKIRSDLYYRLAAISLHLYDLKDRKEDIRDLVESFIFDYSPVIGKDIRELSKKTYDILMDHNWPGNIRELKHVIEHALYITDLNETMILPRHLPKYIYDSYSTKEYLLDYSTGNQNSLKKTLNQIEKQIIIETYNDSKKNISQTARNLGISRQNLQHKLKAYKVKS